MNAMDSQTAVKKKPLTRFGEFELLKAIAILGLPAVHIMEEAIAIEAASPTLTWLGNGVIGLCAFGPSVFMICMGFGIGGGKTSADSIRRQGIQFLMIGAILNILRWLLPGIIQTLTVHTPLIEDVDYCFQSDIYYFVGIFYIYYSFLKKLKNITTPGLLLLSLLTLSLNTLLTPLTHGLGSHEIIKSIVGNIVYVDDTSCFPLLSWSIFPTVGILLGEILKKSSEEQREVYMRRLLDFSAVLFVSFVVFLWDYNIDIMKTLVSPLNDYITDLPNVILLLTLALLLIGLTYYLCKVIGASKFMGFMLRISAFIIPFYLLQWVLSSWIFYGYTIFRVPNGSYKIWMYLITVIIVTAICIVVSVKYGMKIMKKLLKITSFKSKKKKAAR